MTHRAAQALTFNNIYRPSHILGSAIVTISLKISDVAHNVWGLSVTLQGRYYRDSDLRSTFMAGLVVAIGHVVDLFHFQQSSGSSPFSTNFMKRATILRSEMTSLVIAVYLLRNPNKALGDQSPFIVLQNPQRVLLRPQSCRNLRLLEELAKVIASKCNGALLLG